MDQPNYMRVVRAMIDRHAVKDIGADGFALVMMIAVEQEGWHEVNRGMGWVMTICGFSSRERLTAAINSTVAAGWLRFSETTHDRGIFSVQIPGEREEHG